MARPKHVPVKPTARQKLQPSTLRQTQLELMGEDVDLTSLYLNLKGSGVNIVEAVTDVQIERTVEGASTVTVSVLDRDLTLLNSGRLSARNDIEIDGLFFRLAGVKLRGGRQLDLIFEDREVALLRTYSKPIKQSLKTSRARVTRAEFVLRLLREVREEKIRYVIPELHKQQPIDGAQQLPPTQYAVQNRGYGIPKNSFCTVKGQQMSEVQRKNANAILDVGSSKVLPRKFLVMAMMCAIQESSLTNLRQPQPGAYNYLSANPDFNPVGIFQQIKHWGWPASRDVAKDAAAFFDKLVPVVNGNPTLAYYAAIDKVQNSGNPNAYAQWRTEAERIVTAYGLTAGTSASANAQWEANAGTTVYEFYRGLPPTSKIRKQKYNGRWGPENSWDCIQRLAQEVQWRAFFVSGTFYFIAEDELFKSKPIATIDLETDGVDDITGDYDEGKKTATLNVSCRMGRWAAPPGSVVQVVNMGPWNGRWLVNDVTRSAFSSLGTITLKKPLPRLPEPSGSNLSPQSTAQATWTGAAASPKDPHPKQFKTGTALVFPIPQGKSIPPVVSTVHDTLGLPGYPAIDFFASPGTPVVAPENGVIEREGGLDPLTGHNPLLGAVEGAGGPLGWSIYLHGDSGAWYYITHLDKRYVTKGQRVDAGQEIATVAMYVGRESHTHIGIKPEGPNSVTVEELANAPRATAS